MTSHPAPILSRERGRGIGLNSAVRHTRLSVRRSHIDNRGQPLLAMLLVRQHLDLSEATRRIDGRAGPGRRGDERTAPSGQELLVDDGPDRSS